MGELVRRWLYVSVVRFSREQLGVKLHYRQQYQEYLLGPRWFFLRSVRLWWDGWNCVDCGSRVGLQCHHISYEHKGGSFLGEFLDLRTVCRDCHRDRHHVMG